MLASKDLRRTKHDTLKFRHHVSSVADPNNFIRKKGGGFLTALRRGRLSHASINSYFS